jgi:hypothetical protein
VGSAGCCLKAGTPAPPSCSPPGSYAPDPPLVCPLVRVHSPPGPRMPVLPLPSLWFTFISSPSHWSPGSHTPASFLFAPVYIFPPLVVSWFVYTRVEHGYTAGHVFPHCTLTCKHYTHAGYIPTRPINVVPYETHSITLTRGILIIKNYYGYYNVVF